MYFQADPNQPVCVLDSLTSLGEIQDFDFTIGLASPIVLPSSEVA